MKQRRRFGVKPEIVKVVDASERSTDAQSNDSNEVEMKESEYSKFKNYDLLGDNSNPSRKELN